MIGVPTIEQAATTTASGSVTIGVQVCEKWTVQVDLASATADITIYGRAHRDGDWVDITEADLEGVTGSVIQSGEIPLDQIKVDWANLAGGSIEIFSILRRAAT